jgi:alcohol dehydrogenase, propanol-preferring
VEAVRLLEWAAGPKLVEVDEPTPGPGEVVVRVAGAGVCHSDLHLLDASAGQLPFRPPFTLGHEIAGWVSRVGAGVDDVAVGEAVAVYGPAGCGACPRCARGAENYCDRRADVGSAGLGLGRDGGMAGEVLVPSTRLLVPLGELDPRTAAPLTDAALTPYHAIARCRRHLDEGSLAVVIGVGGLGHVAVQLLKTLTQCDIVAVDTRTAALDLAVRAGADHVTGPDQSERVIRAASQGRGADVVFDFVGASATLALAVEVLRTDGELAIVGSGGGQLTLAKPARLPFGTTVSLPFWGTRGELADVVALAQRGLHVETTQFRLDEAERVFEELRAGALVGRAVLVPNEV